MYGETNAPFSNNGQIRSTQNQILSALPKEEYQRILPYLEFVTLNQGAVIYHADAPINYVYFPISGMISITCFMQDGKTVEIGNVGKEGMAGIDVVLGVDRASNESLVEIPGAAFRTTKVVIQREFKQCGELQELLLRYTHALLVQASQTGVCNRLHTVEQRFAVWMLTCRDRIESDFLPLTQEFIAASLGVNRPTITVTASKFQNENLITYSRGKINIVNPKGLEKAACECLQIMKQEYAALPK